MLQTRKFIPMQEELEGKKERLPVQEIYGFDSKTKRRTLLLYLISTAIHLNGQGTLQSLVGVIFLIPSNNHSESSVSSGFTKNSI